MFCRGSGIGFQENLIGYWPFCGNPNDLAGNNNGSVSGPQLSNDRFGNHSIIHICLMESMITLI